MAPVAAAETFQRESEDSEGQLKGEMRFDWRAEGLACEIVQARRQPGTRSSRRVLLNASAPSAS
jgi:hypothetical protein